MSTPAPVSLPLSAPIVADTPITSGEIMSGKPVAGFLNSFENSARGLSVGQWVCEPGAWHFTAKEDEVCTILSGRGRLVSDEGTTINFAAGDSFVIPRGFVGLWETIEAIRKIYVVVE